MQATAKSRGLWERLRPIREDNLPLLHLGRNTEVYPPGKDNILVTIKEVNETLKRIRLIYYHSTIIYTFMYVAIIIQQMDF